MRSGGGVHGSGVQRPQQRAQLRRSCTTRIMTGDGQGPMMGNVSRARTLGLRHALSFLTRDACGT